MTTVNLAILFWCYKELALCEDRVRSMRRDNPDTRIFVLFGGEPEDSSDFEQALTPFIDDFYVFDDEPPPIPPSFPDRFRGGVYWKYMWGGRRVCSKSL